MDNTRKVKIYGDSVYQNDSGVGSFFFVVNRIYNAQDLSKCFAYLMINFSDDTGDKIKLEQTPEEDEIRLEWKIDSQHTRVPGKAECQICFENEDSTVVYNSEVFEVDIKSSVVVDLCNIQAVPTVIQQLQTELREGLEYVKGVVDGGIVTKVNGKSGEVAVTADSIGAAEKSFVDGAIADFTDGTKKVGKAAQADSAESARCDGKNNVIDETYLKKTDAVNKWQKIEEYNELVGGASFSRSLGGRFRKVFIVIDLAGSTVNASGSGSITVSSDSATYGTVQICTPRAPFLPKTANKRLITYLIEVCGEYAKVWRSFTTYSGGTDNGDYEIPEGGSEYSSAETAGVNIGQDYISSISFSLTSPDSDYKMGVGSKVILYGLKAQ